MRIVVAAASLALLWMGCGTDPKPVECSVNSNCNLEPGGLCETNPTTGNKWCTYPCSLPGCDSTRCWSDFDTGDGLSGSCVVYDFDAGVPDAGVPDAPVDDARTPDASLAMSIIQVSAAEQHTCAVLGNGRIRCWGYGGVGRLGYGNQNSIGDNETPFSAGDITVGALVDEVGTGTAHTCVRAGTNVRCWGFNMVGELGLGNTTTVGDNETPSSVTNVAIGGDVIQIAVGNQHSCALLTGGFVRCWGLATRGQLGYGNENNVGDNETPLSAGNVPVGGTVTQIRAGGDRTCVVLDTQNIRCWGRDDGQGLGYGTGIGDIGDNEAPSSFGDINVGAPVKEVAVGWNHICILLTNGTVRCWGYNGQGQLGYGNTTQLNVEPNALGNVDLGGTVDHIAAGKWHTCALMQGGGVRCWGRNDNGQLGYGHLNPVGDNETPASAGDVDLGGPAIGITVGGNHTCARMQDGNVRCWGKGADGRLGYGNEDNIGDTETPASAGNVPVL